MSDAIPWTSRNGIRKNIPAITTRKNHPQGASTSANPLETTITKVIHTMLPIAPSRTASRRTPLEAIIAYLPPSHHGSSALHNTGLTRINSRNQLLQRNQKQKRPPFG